MSGKTDEMEWRAAGKLEHATCNHVLHRFLGPAKIAGCLFNCQQPRAHSSGIAAWIWSRVAIWLLAMRANPFSKDTQATRPTWDMTLEAPQTDWRSWVCAQSMYMHMCIYRIYVVARAFCPTASTELSRKSMTASPSSPQTACAVRTLQAIPVPNAPSLATDLGDPFAPSEWARITDCSPDFGELPPDQ